MILQYEGNIGSGKTTHASTLVDELRSLGFTVIYLPEPLDVWTNYNGVNILEEFYANKKEKSFFFQATALTTMLKHEEIAKALTTLVPDVIVVMERSSKSVSMFSKMLLNLGYLSTVEYSTLFALQKQIKGCENVIHNVKNHITLFLDTNPTECFSRIEKRSRKEERDQITVEYLEKLAVLHDETITSGPDFGKVIHINDYNCDIKTLSQLITKSIKNFVNPVDHLCQMLKQYI